MCGGGVCERRCVYLGRYVGKGGGKRGVFLSVVDQVISGARSGDLRGKVNVCLKKQ